MKRFLCPNGHTFWKDAEAISRHNCPICHGLALHSVTPPKQFQPTAKEVRLDFSMEHYQALRNVTVPRRTKEIKKLRKARDDMASLALALVDDAGGYSPSLEADVLQAEVYCRGAAGVSSQPPPPPPDPASDGGWTAIETLISVAIIGILFVIIIASVSSESGPTFQEECQALGGQFVDVEAGGFGRDQCIHPMRPAEAHGQ